MRRSLFLFLLCAFAFLAVNQARADTTQSFTGILASSEDTFTTTINVTASGTTADIQTWSFGGGTNGAGVSIPEGSDIPLVALYSGTGASASIVTVDYVTDLLDTQVLSDTYDASAANPAVSADSLITGSGASLGGLCPPGNMVAGTCGDATLIITGLPAGVYTLLLSDAFYIPTSVNPGPPASVLLSDGFTDLTGGSFTYCDPTSTATCGAFAVDVTLSGSSSGPPPTTPEPATMLLLGAGLLGIAGFRKRRN